MSVQSHLQQEILLFDGAMGSYFSSLHPDPLYPCEFANLTHPDEIAEIHRRYLKAGANAIKTNTFSLPKEHSASFSGKELIQAAYALAKKEADAFGAFVFADLNLSPVEREDHNLSYYQALVDVFLEEGASNFLFETCASTLFLPELCGYIREKSPSSFILCSFSVNQDGFSETGESMEALLEALAPWADGLGLNCVCGPHHMLSLLRRITVNCPISIMPNASYPTVLGNRVSYGQNAPYFAEKMQQIAKEGCQILGGCCGTTPEFIAELKTKLDTLGEKEVRVSVPAEITEKKQDRSLFYEKLRSGKKPIAVEWDSPTVPEIQDYLRDARKLQEASVDLITIADGPGARPRMDSSLVACKLKRELNMDVLPHLTCRDRNINASKALLLGLAVEEIRDILIVTGDPIPKAQRDEIKTVYEFNSRMLMRHITQLHQQTFPQPFSLYGALNINAVNFKVQIRMAKEKIEHGAVGFFTQPVMSERGFENLKLAKQEIPAPLIGGIFPATSDRNITFLTNEMAGFHVSQEIFSLYQGKTAEECSELAVRISGKIMEEIQDYVDGFYLITPFKRVDLILEILKNWHSR